MWRPARKIQFIHIPKGYYCLKGSVAEIDEVNTSTVQHWITQGRLPTIRVGAFHLINKKDLNSMQLKEASRAGYSQPKGQQ